MNRESEKIENEASRKALKEPPMNPEAQAIIDQYDIRYIYVGQLEYGSMPVKEEKFRIHLKTVFQQGSVTVYEVP